MVGGEEGSPVHCLLPYLRPGLLSLIFIFLYLLPMAPAILRKCDSDHVIPQLKLHVASLEVKGPCDDLQALPELDLSDLKSPS